MSKCAAAYLRQERIAFVYVKMNTKIFVVIILPIQRVVMLVDTSVWVDHLRRTELELVRLLDNGEVMIHPFIIGELACGNLSNRNELLTLFRNLPQAVVASHEEVVTLIEQESLMGKGLGYVDMHLLASSILSDCQLWTKDKRLVAVMKEIGVAD